jgi:hypothetical protein
MSHQPEARDIGHRVHAAGCRHQPRSRAIERRHGLNCIRNPGRLCFSLFECRCNDSGTDRLGEDQRIACLRSRIRKHPLRIDQACYGITKLDLGIANTVPADHGTTSLRHLWTCRRA